METPECVDSSLERSARLGLRVLERARRRRVRWTSVMRDVELTVAPRENGAPPAESFESLLQLMANTSRQCQRYYRCAHASEHSEDEVNHVCRYHTHLPQSAPSAQVRGVCAPQEAPAEDFRIEVSPGTYSVSAGVRGGGERTQLVSVAAGESVTLTFNL